MISTLYLNEISRMHTVLVKNVLKNVRTFLFTLAYLLLLIFLPIRFRNLPVCSPISTRVLQIVSISRLTFNCVLRNRDFTIYHFSIDVKSSAFLIKFSVSF